MPDERTIRQVRTLVAARHVICRFLMRSPILLISLLVLMLMQAWMGVLPTRLICLPSPTVASICGEHTEAAGAPCDSHEDAVGTEGHHHTHDGMHADECADHSHGVVGILLHEAHDCACHVHYPSDDEAPVAPGTQTRIDPLELRPLLTQSTVALLATISTPVIFTPVHDASADLLLSEQILGLKTTRILV